MFDLASSPARYEVGGYLCPIPILSKDAVRKYRGDLDASGKLPGVPEDWEANPHLIFPWAAELVKNAEILHVVRSLIGDNVLCWGVSIFAKPAKSKKFISWHQDATYWGMESDQIITAWLALSPSTRVSGCMKVIPGSHKRPVVPHHESYGADNMLSRGQEVAVDVDENDAVYFELAPGEASFHHVRIFHGSEANHSDDDRIGVAIRYVAPDVRVTSHIGGMGVLVSGQNTTERFELVPMAHRPLSPEALHVHAAYNDYQNRVVMGEGQVK